MYILVSADGARHYIGSTSDVAKRVEEHNSSRAHWTRRYQPWKLVYTEDFTTRGEAVRRERALKKLKGISRYVDSLGDGKTPGLGCEQVDW